MSRLSDVFGVSNEIIESYVERNDVDGSFKDALERKKQIVVYGSSKQGKSSLVKKHLKADSTIQYQAAATTELIDIYSSILRQSGVQILTDYTIQESRGGEVGGSFRARVKIPFLAEAEAGVNGKGEGARSQSKSYKTVEYNLSLAQDITEILHEINFNKFVVLDNFHYLSEEVQKQFAIDLRNFQDKDIRFIILGIWRERNRLLQFNGDLQDRVIEVAVEPWDKKDLQQIITTGSEILKVDFSEIADKIISDSFDSVGVLQELLKESCEAADVTETTNETVKITLEHLQSAVCRKLEDYSNRHMRAFETFAYQGRKTRDGQVPLFIPY